MNDDYGRSINEVSGAGSPGCAVLLAGDPDFVGLLLPALRRLSRVDVACPGRAPFAPATLDEAEPDLIVLAGYMDRVHDDVLDAYTVWGFHPSLLPRYRGGSAVKWQAAAEEPELGVTIYRLVAGKMDAGPIVLQRRIRPLWAEGESVGSFYRRLREAGVAALVAAVAAYRDGAYTYTPQDESLATWHPRLAPGEGPPEGT